MIKQELLYVLIQERVNILLTYFKKPHHNKTVQEHANFACCIFFHHLTEKDDRYLIKKIAINILRIHIYLEILYILL